MSHRKFLATYIWLYRGNHDYIKKLKKLEDKYERKIIKNNGHEKRKESLRIPISLVFFSSLLLLMFFIAKIFNPQYASFIPFFVIFTGFNLFVLIIWIAFVNQSSPSYEITYNKIYNNIRSILTSNKKKLEALTIDELPFSRSFKSKFPKPTDQANILLKMSQIGMFDPRWSDIDICRFFVNILDLEVDARTLSRLYCKLKTDTNSKEFSDNRFKEIWGMQ